MRKHFLTSREKKESVSEMDVLNFLSTIPLQEPTTSISNGIAMVPTRESRKIQFGPEMAVIAAQRGLASRCLYDHWIWNRGQSNVSHILVAKSQQNFKVRDLPVSSPFTDQACYFSDLSKSLCLTLACYRWVDVLPATQRADDTPLLEELVSGVSCFWPEQGGLSVIVQHNETDWQLPLSPPICVRSLYFTFVGDAHSCWFAIRKIQKTWLTFLSLSDLGKTRFECSKITICPASCSLFMRIFRLSNSFR